MYIPRPTLLVALLLVTPALSAADGHPAYRIVVSQSRAHAGEELKLRLEPPPESGMRVTWHDSMGGRGFSDGVTYRAPFRIGPGAPPAQVSADVFGPGFYTSVSAAIDLVPGSVDGSDDCLGPGQSWSAFTGTMEADDRPLDASPQLIGSADPGFAAGERSDPPADPIVVKVLVCRTGRVLGAYPVASFANPFDRDPIRHDPERLAAALATARQYLFMPASRDGQPVAAWTSVAVQSHGGASVPAGPQ